MADRLERLLAKAVFAWLVRRGWIVQLNTAEFCSNPYEREDGTKLDAGWSPLFSIRYGHTPVYRGVGEVRWHG